MFKIHGQPAYLYANFDDCQCSLVTIFIYDNFNREGQVHKSYNP